MSPTEKAGNYKAYNILHKINYWKARGEDPSFLFEGLNLDYLGICENDWLDFNSVVRCVWDNELKKVPDPRSHERLGYDVYRNQSMGAIEIAAKLMGLKYIFRKFVELSKKYSLVEHYEIHELMKNSAILIYSPKREFYSQFGFSSANFIKGFLRAMPKVHEPLQTSVTKQVPDVDVQMALICFNIKDVLLHDYKHVTQSVNLDVSDDEVYFNDDLIAKRISLDVENGLYVARQSNIEIELKNELQKPGTGILVLHDLVLDGTLVLKRGEIFDAPYCRFNITWSGAPILTRIKYLLEDVPRAFKISQVKLLEQIDVADKRYFAEMKAREKAENAEAEVRRYAGKLEEMVEERTRELRETQTKLLESEKRSLEHRITGGFAHEMRNALAGAQIEAKSALKYEEGKPSPEVLKDCAASLLMKISQVQEKFRIPREEMADQLLPEFKTIKKIADHLSEALHGVTKDIDRGLSITNEIREYARLQDLKTGDDVVDIIALFQNYKERYSNEIHENSIKYIICGPKTAKFRAKELHLDSIFNNLVKNAIDALSAHGSGDKRILISIDRNDRHFVVKIEDNGPGIQEKHLAEIFEPFFSTKPTSGVGLGLSIVKRLVNLYGGEIQALSEKNEGTCFLVILPLHRNG